MRMNASMPSTWLPVSTQVTCFCIVNTEDLVFWSMGKEPGPFLFIIWKNREMWCLFSVSGERQSQGFHKERNKRERGIFSSRDWVFWFLGSRGHLWPCKPAESLGRVGRQCLWATPRLYLAVSAQSRLWVVIGEFRYLFLTSSGRLNKGVNPDPGLFITTLSPLWDPNRGQGVESRFISLLLSNLQDFFFFKEFHTCF